MSRLTPSQLAWRRRVEALIRLAEPGLDLLLAAGDRVSRIVEPQDTDYQPATRPLAAEQRRRELGPGQAR